MVISAFDDNFKKKFSKIKDASFKNIVVKQIEKVINNPEIGKPMRNIRKGTREIYVSPYRLSYLYSKEQNKIIFLNLYHKDEQ